jgi:hypothetical protein
VAAAVTCSFFPPFPFPPAFEDEEDEEGVLSLPLAAAFFPLGGGCFEDDNEDEGPFPFPPVVEEEDPCFFIVIQQRGMIMKWKKHQ